MTDKTPDNLDPNFEQLDRDELKEYAKMLAKEMADIVEVRKVTEYHLPPCDICETQYARGMMLVGGYNTFLCTRHENLWHEYVDDTGELVSLHSADLRLKIAISQGEEVKALGFSKGVKIAKRTLYELGKAWVFDSRAKFMKAR